MMIPEWLVIVNPESGAGKAKKIWPLLKQQMLMANMSFEHQFTTSTQKADVIVPHAVSRGVRKFICLGGDGNLQDILNGIMLQKTCAPNEITVGMVSAGTGNDWIKTYNIPKDIVGALKVILNGKTLIQDVGKCTYRLPDNSEADRYFHNFAGVGFDSYVLENTASLKKFGTIAYLLGMLRCIISFKQPEIEISANGKTIKTKVYLMLAGIGKFGGGGMKLTPGAQPDDGLFYVTVAKNFNLFEIIMNVGRLYSGTFISHHKVETFACTRLSVSSKDKNAKVEADGEVLGSCPIQVSIIPKSFCVLVP